MVLHFGPTYKPLKHASWKLHVELFAPCIINIHSSGWILTCCQCYGSCCEQTVTLSVLVHTGRTCRWFSHELKSALCDIIDADYGLLEEMKPMLGNRQYETLYKSYDRNDKLMDIVSLDLLDEDKFCKALQETSQQHVVNFIYKHDHNRPATGSLNYIVFDKLFMRSLM